MDFRRGDSIKIVCLGDSITYGYQIGTKQQVSNPYPKVLEDYLNNNAIKATVINSGKPGWRSSQSLANMDNLVLQHKPDYCIIMLGINDARGSAYGITITKEKYRKNMQKIIDILVSNEIVPIVLTPTKTINKRVEKFSEYLLNSLVNKEIEYVDMHIAVSEKSNDLEISNLLPDGIHFADEYYRWIADIIIEKIVSIID